MLADRIRIVAQMVVLVCLTAANCGCPGEPITTSGQSGGSGSPDTSTAEQTTESPSAPSTTEVGDPVGPPFEFIGPGLTEQELRNGWISLFDSVSLFGWNVPEQSNWHVEDHCIVADQGERSLLTTPFSFDDFELRCEFHLAKGGNSGVFLRTSEAPANPASDTYELNICDSHPTHGTGSLVGRVVAENVPATEGEWHQFHILCNGTRIQVSLDGKQILDFTDTGDHVRRSGTIGLQMNEGRVAFRNIYFRPLNSTELFNGQDLTGLHPVPGSKSKFEVADGRIHITDGPGFLETAETYSDFILHVEARTNGPSLNSGVFFRAQQGTEDAPSNGYEMQIQNGFRNGDRTQPEDSGSGAIFRRAAARYVVANDNEWMVETLIAQGDHFATFVNGYQVVNWQDTREPDENPRKGKRLAAGHLSLQGHDPTTDLDFRSLRITELQSAVQD